MRQVIGLTPSSRRPSSFQDPPSAPLAVQAYTSAVVVVPAPPPPLVALVQEVAPAVEVSAQTTLTGLVVAPLSIVGTPLLSAGVATTSAPKMSSLSSSAPPIPPSAVFASALPSTSSHPSVSLDHIYTS